MKRDSRGRFVSRTRRNPAPKRNAKGQFVGRTRRNPIVGNLRSLVYDRPGDPGPSYEHKSGDFGLFKRKSNAKIVAGKGGKLRITGQRWIPGVGIVG